MELIDRFIKEQDAILEQEPCEDAVNRQAVIDEIYESRKNFNNEFDQGFFADKIKALSPVNPTKTGHWIPIQEIIGVDKEGNEMSVTVGYKCSDCGEKHESKTLYCPSCGAKMESEDKI